MTKLPDSPRSSSLLFLVTVLLTALFAGNAGVADAAPQVDDAVLVVRVVDEDRRPIPRVRVGVYPTEAQRQAAGNGPVQIVNVHTDEDGEARVSVPAGLARSIHLSSRNSEIETKTIEIEPIAAGETFEFDVALRTRDDATFVAQLRDPTTGRPIPGVTVSSERLQGLLQIGEDGAPLAAPRNPAATSDAKGRIELPAATWRQRELTFFARGFAIRRMRVGGAPDAPGLGAPLTLDLLRETTVQVLLVDAPEFVRVVATLYGTELFETDLPLGQPGSVDEFRIFGSPLDQAGSWAIRGVPPNSALKLQVLEDGKVIAERESLGTGEPDTETKVVMDLRSIGHVIVTVRDENGEPRANAEVWYGPRGGQIGGRFASYEKPEGKLTTDAEGRASITGLRPGPFRFSLQPTPLNAPDQEIATAAVVDVDSRGVAQDVELRIYKGLSIKGTLLGPDGQPTPAHVFVSGGSEVMYCSAQASFRGPTGVFEVGPLLPGSYRISATSLLRPDGHASPLPMNAEAGAEDVVVRFRASGSLGIRCEDELGAPVKDADVRFIDSDTPRQEGARLDDDGRSTFTTVPIGEHHLMARTPDGRISDWIPVTIEEGETLEDVRVVVRRQGTLVLTCADRTGLEPRPINYTILGESGLTYVSTMSAGETARLPVPTGEVTLTLGRLEYAERPSFAFEFDAGETIEHSATLLPAVPPEANAGAGSRDR